MGDVAGGAVLDAGGPMHHLEGRETHPLVTSPLLSSSTLLLPPLASLTDPSSTPLPDLSPSTPSDPNAAYGSSRSFH